MHSVSNAELPALQKKEKKRPLNEGVSEVEWKNLEESMINFEFEALSASVRLAQAWCKFLIRRCFIFQSQLKLLNLGDSHKFGTSDVVRQVSLQ